MRLIEIANRVVTVELSPEDCRLLSICCDLAPERDAIGQQAAMAEALAGFFAASALAAQAPTMDAHGIEERATLSNLGSIVRLPTDHDAPGAA